MNISFKKYKPFSAFTTLDLSKFNLILGQNSSGKSSLTEFISHYVDFATKGLSSLDNIYILTDLTNSETFGALSQNIDDLKPEEKRALQEMADTRSQSDLDDLENRKIFPKYYNMSQLKNFKSDSEYDVNSKHLFNFKYNPNFLKKPVAVSLIYNTLCKVDERKLRRLFYNEYTEEFNTSNPILNKFYEKINKELEALNNHPQSNGLSEHSTEVRVSNKMVKYNVTSKKPYGDFLNGLNIVRDKNSNESFMYFSDGSKIDSLIKNTVTNLTETVFEKLLDSVEGKFQDYKNQYRSLYPDEKMPKYPLTMPLMVDTSKLDFKKDDKNSSIEKFMGYISYCKPFDNSIIKMSEQSNNLWNVSPYIYSHFYKQNNNYISRLRTTKYIGLREVFPSSMIDSDPIRNFRPHTRTRYISEEFQNNYKDTFYNDPINFLEHSKHEKVREDNQTDSLFYTDFDFYKDFILTKHDKSPDKVLRSMSSDFVVKNNKATQPAFGAIFKIANPTLRKGIKDGVPSIKRDVVSDIKAIRKFILDARYQKLFRDFENLNLSTPSGNIKTFRYTGYRGVNHPGCLKSFISSRIKNNPNYLQDLAESGIDNLLSEYVDMFSYSIDNSSLFYKRKVSKKSLKRLSIKYGISQAAVNNQIEVIRLYLLRLTIVQFQMNVSKYLFSYYIRKFNILNINFEINTVRRSDGALLQSRLGTSSVTTIQPNNGRIFKKYSDTRVSSKDLISFFGENSKNLFQNNEDKDVEILNFKLNDFCTFINKSLKSLEQEIEINIKPEYYENKDIISNKYSFTIKETGALQGLPIFNRGMGDSLVISLLGALYNFKTQLIDKKNILIIREPEAYIHPNLIVRIIEFLYKFVEIDNPKSKNRNLRIIIESHSETVLRAFQMIMKKSKSKSKMQDLSVFYIKPKIRTINPEDLKGKKIGSVTSKRVGSVILNLGLQENGFLETDIPKGFFDVNTNLIEELWK